MQRENLDSSHTFSGETLYGVPRFRFCLLSHATTEIDNLVPETFRLMGPPQLRENPTMLVRALLRFVENSLHSRVFCRKIFSKSLVFLVAFFFQSLFFCVFCRKIFRPAASTRTHCLIYEYALSHLYPSQSFFVGCIRKIIAYLYHFLFVFCQFVFVKSIGLACPALRNRGPRSYFFRNCLIIRCERSAAAVLVRF